MIGNQTDSAFGVQNKDYQTLPWHNIYAYEWYKLFALLDDLIRFADHGMNCKVLLIGDVAQLPPVGLVVSPALVPEELKMRYFKEVFQVELKEVVRQAKESGILSNATALRQLLEHDQIKYSSFDSSDVVRLAEKNDLEDALNLAGSNHSMEDSYVLCSNKRANIYNQQIH